MFTFLLTDIFFYIIFFSLILYINYVRKTPDLKQTWQHVFRNKTGIISVVVLSFFMITALLDSIHIKDKSIDKITIELFFLVSKHDSHQSHGTHVVFFFLLLAQ